MNGDSEFLESLCIISQNFAVDLKSSGWSKPENKGKKQRNADKFDEQEMWNFSLLYEIPEEKLKGKKRAEKNICNI